MALQNANSAANPSTSIWYDEWLPILRSTMLAALLQVVRMAATTLAIAISLAVSSIFIFLAQITDAPILADSFPSLFKHLGRCKSLAAIAAFQSAATPFNEILDTVG